MYVVVSGRLQVTTRDGGAWPLAAQRLTDRRWRADGRAERREVVLATLAAGNCFGESALVDGQPRRASGSCAPAPAGPRKRGGGGGERTELNPCVLCTGAVSALEPCVLFRLLTPFFARLVVCSAGLGASFRRQIGACVCVCLSVRRVRDVLCGSYSTIQIVCTCICSTHFIDYYTCACACVQLRRPTHCTASPASFGMTLC